MKTCTKCGETKALDAFTKAKYGAGGRSAECRACAHLRYLACRVRRNEVAKVWQRANPEKVKAYAITTRKRHPEVYRAKSARNNKLAALTGRRAAWRKRSMEEMRPDYIARALRLPVADVPPELRDAKRQQLTIHRVTTQLKEHLNETV